MSTTGQKAHRRTTSLSAGFNSSSDDLAPVQRSENSRSQQQYLSPLNTQPSPKNAHLSVPSGKGAPSTPSKTKPDPIGVLINIKRISKIRIASIKNYAFTAVFFLALYIFLSSLCGIGDVPDYVQVSRTRKKITSTSTPTPTSTPSIMETGFVLGPPTATARPQEELWNREDDEPNGRDRDQDQEPNDPFGVINSGGEKHDEAENADQHNNAPELYNAPEMGNAAELDDARELDNALQLDSGAQMDHTGHHGDSRQPESDAKQQQEPDEGIFANPFGGISSSSNKEDEEAGADVVVNDNFGHTDEILANNGKHPFADSATDARLAGVDLGSDLPDSLPNMLSKQDRKNPNAKDGQTDYSTYEYETQTPHFTYLNALTLLSEDERVWIRQARERQMLDDESNEATCGNWQRRFANMQQDIMAGNTDQRYVAYVCDSSTNCGGLSDRIFGMASAFLFALFTNRAFLADWQVPMPLDAIFESPNIDWNYNSLDENSPLRYLDSQTLDIVNYSSQHLDRTLFHANWTLKYPEPFITFHSNRGIVIGAYKSKIYAPALSELGLRQQFAFGCILDYLFRPKPTAMSFITYYTSLFALPNVFSVGIQIQTGNKHLDDPHEQQTLISQYYDFFRCADQLAATYSTTGQQVLYFLVTDSENLRNAAISRENVIVTGLPTSTSQNYRTHADLVHNSVIENWILSKTNYRVVSPGGYSKLAAFHSKMLHSTVTMYPPSEQETRDFYHRTVPDCTREDAFTTFLEFASEGSLG